MAATFFATPLGAAPLLMINASRTGKNPLGVGGLALGLFGVVVGVGMLPVPIPSIVFTLVQVMGIRQLHHAYFETDVRLRAEDGIGPAPWWHALVICLVGLTLQIGFVALIVSTIGLDAFLEP